MGPTGFFAAINNKRLFQLIFPRIPYTHLKIKAKRMPDETARIGIGAYLFLA